MSNLSKTLFSLSVLFFSLSFFINPNISFAECPQWEDFPDYYFFCSETAPYPPSAPLPSCVGGHFSKVVGGYLGVTLSQFKDITQTPYERDVCTDARRPSGAACSYVRSQYVGEISCADAGTCGTNGIKDIGECCDPSESGADPSLCDSNCRCIGSNSSIGFCGDGACNGYEDENNCSTDCSGGSHYTACSVGNVISANMPPVQPSSVTLYQGDQDMNFLYQVGREGFDGGVAYNVGCPTGFDCPVGNVSLGVLDSEEPDITGYFQIDIGSNTPLGNYTLSFNVFDPANPACQITLPFNVEIRASRKSVCDNVWHEIPPGSAGPNSSSWWIGADLLARFENGASYYNKFVKATYGATNLATGGGGTYSTFCRYLDGFGDTCTWDSPISEPPGWWGNVGAIGTGPSVIDGGGRTYELRKRPETMYSSTIFYLEYKCNPPTATANISADPLSVAYNGTSNITWYSTDASSCSVTSSGSSDNWSSLDGSQVSSTLTVNPTTYAISCLPAGPGSNASVNISVGAPPLAVADISANGSDGPVTIPYNGSANVIWSSNYATDCSVSCTGGCSGWIGLVGNKTENLTSPRTYVLSCNPIGPNSSDSVQVNVNAPIAYGLTVIKAGQGTVTSSPAGINCGSGCQSQMASFVQDTSVTISATPAAGRVFTGWNGACSGIGACVILMNGVKSVTANFALDPAFKEF